MKSTTGNRPPPSWETSVPDLTRPLTTCASAASESRSPVCGHRRYSTNRGCIPRGTLDGSDDEPIFAVGLDASELIGCCQQLRHVAINRLTRTGLDDHRIGAAVRFLDRVQPSSAPPRGGQGDANDTTIGIAQYGEVSCGQGVTRRNRDDRQLETGSRNRTFCGQALDQELHGDV